MGLANALEEISTLAAKNVILLDLMLHSSLLCGYSLMVHFAKQFSNRIYQV
jgi:hypothetical protein